jgi:S1-C subfamily serine protease
MNVKFPNQPSFWQRAVAAPLAGLLAANLAPPPARAGEPDVRRDAAVDAIEKVLPSVVNIATATIVEYHDFYDTLLQQFYGVNRPGRRREQPDSIGSGVIVDEEGYVLTNFHVLRRASRVQVKLWDGRIYDAEPVVVYTSQKDVALLKLRAKPGETFQAIKFAKDDDLLLGETVLALGNPYGLGGSVSRGILSSKARRPALGDEPLDVQDWLQTDAAINPGNSGGPLINLRGELIGLNVAVYREEQGMGVGFAIPVKQAAAALSDFFTPEWTDSVWFGAKVRAGPHPLAVTSVQPGSPADKAGLRVGQEIVEVNGKAPTGLINFNRLVLANPAKRAATITVVEKGARRTLQAQLVPFDSLIRAKLGLSLSSLTRDRAALFQVNPGEGLFIEAVEKNGPADRAQIQKDYLLTAMDGQSTGELLGVINILATKNAGDRVRLSVLMRRRFGNGYLQLQQGTATVQVR